MAYANNDERHWWESGLYGGKFYWPPHVAVSDTIETWVEVFLSDGYESTDNHDIEPGVEKVAIYVDANSMEPTHVAKSNGHIWKSKLGKGVDIEHKSLDLLIGDQQDEYGIVGKILRRPKHNETENNA